jgi:hypothetical protein
MPLIRAQFLDLKYDMAAHRKTLDAALQVQMRQAARAWLREVILHVPVWTGMAKSSLKPLGRFLRVAIPITPHPRAVPTKHKNMALGEQQQEFGFENSGALYSFSWTTDVLHYQLNEFHTSSLPLIHPTPWRSTHFGALAFQRYVADILPKRIPNAADFIRSSYLRVDRS